jgi:hypothetical protein
LKRAVILGGGVVAFGVAVTYVVLRLVIGPEPYAGVWQITDQLSLAQLLATWLAIFLATTFGIYAVETLDLGRRTERAEQARERQRLAAQMAVDQARLHDALTALRSSLDHNRRQLGERGGGLPRIIVEGQAPWEPQLDAATWDAVQADVVSLLHDPTLAAKLARHFEEIRSLATRVDRYFQFSWAPWPRPRPCA